MCEKQAEQNVSKLIQTINSNYPCRPAKTEFILMYLISFKIWKLIIPRYYKIKKCNKPSSVWGNGLVEGKTVRNDSKRAGRS